MQKFASVSMLNTHSPEIFKAVEILSPACPVTQFSTCFHSPDFANFDRELSLKEFKSYTSFMKGGNGFLCNRKCSAYS